MRVNPIVVCEWLLFIRLWWAHVTVIPDERRIAVFRSGTWKGLNGMIPVGGHITPISIVGERLLWKYAQKNDTKKKISEVMKRIMPNRMLLLTCMVWCP